MPFLRPLWQVSLIATVCFLANACSRSAAQEALPPSEVRLQQQQTIRQRLAAERIIDQPGTVSAAVCAAEDSAALSGATFATCDVLAIESGGMLSRAYLFSRGAQQLTIFHEGHNSPEREQLDDALMPDTRQLLIELLHTSDVLYFDMPLLGVNSGRKITIKGREVSATTHDRFALLDEPGHSALAYFLNPIDLVLDQIAPRYARIKMIGRSGGGWTTTVYSALDERIDESISVAGSAPIVVRGIDSDGRDDLGDWEQYGATIYRWLDYQDLYALAASGGRRHEQLYFEFDNCCFSGIKGAEAQQVYEAAYGTGTSVAFTILDGTSDHYAMPVPLLAEKVRN